MAGIFGGITRHAAELNQLPAEVPEDPPQNSLTLADGELRQGQFQIAGAHTAQTAQGSICAPCQQVSYPTRHPSRHPPQGARHG